jgi:hypothetical protein
MNKVKVAPNTIDKILCPSKTCAIIYFVGRAPFTLRAPDIVAALEHWLTPFNEAGITCYSSYHKSIVASDDDTAIVSIGA